MSVLYFDIDQIRAFAARLEALANQVGDYDGSDACAYLDKHVTSAASVLQEGLLGKVGPKVSSLAGDIQSNLQAIQSVLDYRSGLIYGQADYYRDTDYQEARKMDEVVF
ncbi:MAG: hypothetical protein FWD63_06145 [Propionibacteriaceae bacterium]|nr:hypothetical protein [Propionibacteriaceae bacterium]